MKLRMVVVDARPSVVGAAVVVVGEGDEVLVESLGPQEASPTASARPIPSVAATDVNLRTSTSGRGRTTGGRGSDGKVRVWGCERRIATPVVVGRIVPAICSRTLVDIFGADEEK